MTLDSKLTETPIFQGVGEVEFQNSLEEFRQNLLVKSSIVISIFIIILLDIVTMEKTDLVLINGLVMVLLGIGAYLVFRFFREKPKMFFTIWTIFFIVSLGLLINLMKIPELTFALSLVPLVAAFGLGKRAWLFSMVLSIGLAIMLNMDVFPFPIPDLSLGLSLIFILLFGILAFILADEIWKTFGWYAGNYRKNREALVFVRERQLELDQIREDLMVSNRELTRFTTQLKTMTQIAQDALKAKEAFVANVSHELRTPLNMIIGFSEMITQSPERYGSDIPDKLLGDIVSIQRNSRHLSRLVNDILDLSRVDAGEMAIHREWSDLNEVVAKAIEQVKPLYQSKKLYLKSNIPPGKLIAYIDPVRIREVIINLLSNAGRFTDEGGVDVEIWEQDEYCYGSIRDSGLGIPEDELKTVFEPFMLLDTEERRDRGGSGLGLPICKRFIEMHDGNLWVESEVGVGTIFSFNLPKNIKLHTMLSSNSSRWLSQDFEHHTRVREFKASHPEYIPRYVVYEKENVIGRLLKRYLDKVEIQEVSSLDEARDTFREGPVQIFIVNQPFVAWSETADFIKEVPLGTLVLQSHVPGYQDYANRLGVHDFLIKPVSQMSLLDAVNRVNKSVDSILIVDDQLDLVRLFKRMLLVEKNYHIYFAKNGVEALRMMRHYQPDLCLLDLYMPEKNGFEVIDEMKRDDSIRDIPVIIVSSQDPEGVSIFSKEIIVSKNEGVSTGDFLRGLQNLEKIFTSHDLTNDQADPEVQVY